MKTLIVILCLLPSICFADNFVIQLHGISYHADRKAHYNEHNLGLALRWYPDKSTKIDYYTTGCYDNSLRKQSCYLAAGWEYKASNYVTFDLSAGVISGYDHHHLFLVHSIRFFNFVNLVAIPYPEDVVEVSFDVLKF